MHYVASCSFGKDSLAMLLKLIELNYVIDEVIFFDTGMEFQSIYNNRDKIVDLLRSKNIKYTEIKDEEGFYYKMLVKPVKYKNSNDKPYPYHYGYGWCGGCCRWGTTYKVRAIRNYYKHTYGDEPVVEYVGIALDEPDRVENNPLKLYPLVEWEMTEKDCLKYCYERGYDWNEDGVELYQILDRVSCWCCSNKNLKELKNIYIYLPKYWQMLRGLQSKIDKPMKGLGKSIFDLEERFKQEISALP